jgi:hypothetical protein
MHAETDELAVWAIQTHGGHPHHDQPGVPGHQRLPADPESVHDSDGAVFDDYISLLDKPQEGLVPEWTADIQGAALLGS